MQVVKMSAKSQVVIPVELRKKAGLRPGSEVLVALDREGRVILEAVPEDPIEAACGMLKGGPSAQEVKDRNRREEDAFEAKKLARLIRPHRVLQARTRIRKS